MLPQRICFLGYIVFHCFTCFPFFSWFLCWLGLPGVDESISAHTEPTEKPGKNRKTKENWKREENPRKPKYYLHTGGVSISLSCRGKTFTLFLRSACLFISSNEGWLLSHAL